MFLHLATGSLPQAFSVPFMTHHIKAYLRRLSPQQLALHLGSPALSELTRLCCCSAQLSVTASSPPSSDRLSSRCCEAISAGRGQWAGCSEFLRVAFLLLHFFPCQCISALWPARGDLHWLLKWFWEILCQTHSCMHWQVGVDLGVPCHHPWPSSALCSGTRLPGKVPALVCPTALAPTRPGHAESRMDAGSSVLLTDHEALFTVDLEEYPVRQSYRFALS